MKKLILLFFIYNYFSTYACINMPVTNPIRNYYEDIGLRSVHIPQGHTFKSDSFLLAELKKINAHYAKNKDEADLITKGVLLILLKRYDEAIKLYLNLYKRMDEDFYSIASNLGTAYELIGDNKNAYKWISKATEIDPNSHFNSEWIHINILKLKLNKNLPVTSNALIETNFGLNGEPKTSVSKDSLLELKRAIFFQLDERMSFIKPKDPIIAQLIFDMANINFVLKEYSTALEIYHLSKKYGNNNSITLERIQLCEDKLYSKPKTKTNSNTSKVENNHLWVISSIIATSLLILILIFIYKKR